MKNFGFWFLLLILMTTVVSAQGFRDPYNDPQQSEVMGGLGVTWIDDQPYTTFTLAPELALGKVGVGFYLQLLMDNQNNFKLRKDEYKGGVGLLRAVRYVRYGLKYDPFYARAGMLVLSSLGNGFLMWNYTNASNYDQRKWGLALDVDFGYFGFESVVNNLGRFELAGGNLYFRPFRFINKDAPILKNIRVYGTYVYDDKFPSWEKRDEQKQLSAYGLGADVILLDLPVFRTGIYYDYGKFLGNFTTLENSVEVTKDFGHGQAVGINAIFPEMIGLFGLSAKFEKRWLGDQFIPSFFGPQYELDRELDPFKYSAESGIVRLQKAEKNEGYFGQLAGHIINKVRLAGNYQRLNGIKGSGIVHLEALAPDLVPKFELAAYYDKRGIETFEDFRTLDNRSLAAAEVGYRLNMFMVLSVIYKWSWVEIEDEKGNMVYRPQERIEPRLSFSYRF